jgi:hypothetical protein
MVAQEIGIWLIGAGIAVVGVDGLPDQRASKDDLVRIVDEGGDDYLFHKTQFAFVDFPEAVRKKLLALPTD